MAQIVKLKRTSVQGKVPTVSNVELGELAINTYDGRIFFEKSSSNESIQEILTTNTGRPITGSININGAITASYFKGDGSALTNIQASVSEQVTVTSSFESESTIDVAHNFSSKNVIVSVYDSSDNQIIPQTVNLTDTDNVRVVLSSAQSGFVVVAKGGHIVSGSADDSNRLNGQLASYYLNYNNFNNVPSGLVSGSSQITDGSGIVSGSSQITLSSTTGYNANEHFTQANITTVGTVTSGNINAILPDGVISGSSQLTSTFDSRYLNTNGDGVLSGSITSQLPSGTVSGSDQVASTFAQTILDDTSAGAVRTTIGVDAAGTDNSTDVTLTGTPNYITISGQVITRNTIDIGDDTNLTAGTGITLTGDTLSTTDSEIVHDNLSGFVANEHIDHSTITVGSGKGLQGGGTIDTNRSLSLHTGSAHFTSGVKDKLNTEGVLSGSSHSGDQTFDDNVIVTGNLTVNGTTTSVNSNTVNIGDNIIVLNSDESGTPSQDAGIEVERGTSTNVRFQFKESTDRWQFSNDGSTYFNLPTSTADVAEYSNLYYTDTRVKTKLNTEGVISGSSQVSIGSTTGTLAVNKGGTGATTAAGARTNLGVDAAGTDNSTDVTLGGSYDYITISGQTITRNQVDASTDISNLTTANVSEVTNLYYTDARVKTKLNVEGVLSGSNFVTTGSNTFVGDQDITGYVGITRSKQQLRLIDSDNNRQYNFHVNEDAFYINEQGTSNKIFRVVTGSLDHSILVEQDGVTIGNDLLVNGNISGSSFNGTGLISGSAQITDLTTHKETVSGASSYAVTHNLNEQYPIVQCWDTSTSQQVQASDVTTNSANQVTVEFAANFAGVIIVKK